MFRKPGYSSIFKALLLFCRTVCAYMLSRITRLTAGTGLVYTGSVLRFSYYLTLCQADLGRVAHSFCSRVFLKTSCEDFHMYAWCIEQNKTLIREVHCVVEKKIVISTKADLHFSLDIHRIHYHVRLLPLCIPPFHSCHRKRKTTATKA